MKTSGKRGAFGTMPSLRMRRIWRRVSLAMVLTFALLTAVPVANAADVSSPGFPLPGLGSLFASTPSWAWSGLPKQPSGTAAGHSHTATAAETRSGKGVGSGRGKGKGELDPAPKPHTAKVTPGLSAEAGDGVAPGTFASRTKFKSADGVLHPIDTSLVAGKDGRLGKKADSQQVSFAPTAADSALMTVADGRYGVSFSLGGAAPVAAAVSGAEAVYPAALPDVDLHLTATRTGAKEDLVLNSAAAPTTFSYPFTTTGGLTAKAAADGVSFTDAKGVVRFTVPNGTMTDAAVDAHGKHLAVSNGVRFTLAVDGGRQALQMTLDSSWLSAPARVFPVTVDPTVAQTTSTTVAPPTIDSQYPQNSATLGTLTPELLATGHTQPGATYTTPQYDFQVNDAVSGTQLVDSGNVATGDWTVPAGKLLWGHTYYWIVQAWDGQQYSPNSVWDYFTVNVPQPPVTSTLSQNGSGHGYDATQGNYTTTATDADVPGAGPKLQVVRDYNSSDPRTAGAFGAAWSSILDMKASEQYTAPGSGVVASVNVTYPDGSEAGYGRNADGSFSPPLGRFAIFKQVTGGYTLTDKNDTVYTFTQSLSSGVYGITSVADALGRTLTFGWSAGQIATMTSGASGRALHITWVTPTGATGSHVSTVATDPATVGTPSSALTWTYSYTGDQLTQVCSPVDATNACTRYTYGSGSQFPNAALDLAPHSYWRFDEQAGSTAASSVLVNEGNDNAAYANVGFGQPGGLTGSPATSITFNGTNSFATMPNNLVMNSTTASIAMWFKTTGSGTLFSTGHSPGGAANPSGAAMPVLYVGTDGHLHGHYWDYTVVNGSNVNDIAGMASPGVVNDGNWHYVVLTSATSQQWLYLDGQQIGSKNGTIVNVDPYDIVGAGVYNNNGWPAAWSGNTWNYFNGQISDVAYYGQPLSLSQVGLLNQAGRHASSLLTSITQPSGAIAAKIAYEPLTGRVYTVTDNNGGTWTLEPPSVTGSSQVFRSAVMAGAPAGYWRMADPAGSPNAASQVASDGLYASYSNVTLGQTGVFADSTVAGFNGTSSYLRLPDQSISAASGAPASIGLWFKTSASGAQALVGTTHDLPGGSPGPGAMPVMYVGTDGKLHAHYWNGAVTDLSSVGAVNDGKWHEAVLTTSGTAQMLYLDGASVTNTPLAGTTINIDPYNFIGAGVFNTLAWPAGPTVSVPTWSYFNGSIGDFAYFRSQLTGAQVVQMWTASQNSAGVTPVLSTKVVDPAATITKISFDGTTYSATSPKAWDLPGVRLTFQADGNLVAYRNFNTSTGIGTQFWSTGTAGNPNAVLAFQTDGNLVIYSDSTKTRALWMANTNAPQATGNYALFEPDGGLAIYKQDNSLLWSTASPVTSAPGVTITQMDPNSGNRVLADTDAAGVSTTYGYDTSGYQYTATDGDGNTVTTGHDVRGNQVSRTTCQVQYSNVCSTEYYTYWPDDDTVQLAPDPRNDLVTSHRDGRSASLSDNTYLTSYTYDAAGNLTSTTTPPVAGFPNGRTSTISYTTASTAAADSGTTPPGLVAKKTTDAGLATITTYNHNGDVAQTTDPAGLVTTYQYDNLGRMVSKKAVSDSYPNGLVTSYVSDGLNRVTQETNPAVTDRVTGAIHTAVTTTTYDVDGNVTKTQVADATGGDATRTTSSHFNTLDQQDSMTDADGNTTQYGYDLHGHRTKVINANGVETDTAYDADGNVQTNTLIGYTGDPVSPSAATNLVTSSESYDPAGRLGTVIDAMGNKTSYTYTDNGLIASITRVDSTGHNPYVLQSNTYDAAGNLLSRSTHNGSDTTTYQVDAATRVASSTVDPNGVDRTTSYTFSPDNVVTSVNDRDGTGWNRTTTYGLDAAGRQTSKTVHASANGNGPAVAAGQVGSWPLGDGQSGTAADASGNGDTGTLTGGASWSTDHGGSAVFDGSTGAVTMPQAAVDTTKSFTVSTWAKATSNASLSGILSQGGTQQALMAIYAGGGSTGAWAFAMGSADAGWSFDWVSSGVTVVPGQWVQITGVFNAATSTASIYINGVLKGTVSHAARLSSSGMEIGRMKGNGAEGSNFNGEVSGTRTYNRVLTDQEIQYLYSGTPQQQTQSGLTGQWNLTDGNVGTAADTSGNNDTGTLTGGVSWSTDRNGSAVFDGAGGDITGAPVVDSSKSFSVSAWAKLSNTNGYHFVVGQSGQNMESFYLDYDDYFKSWSMVMPGNDTSSPGWYSAAAPASALQLNTWTHLVGEYNAATGTISIYVNGALAGTATTNSAWNSKAVTGAHLTIGGSNRAGANSAPFAGKVSAVQVYNRALSANEVSSLYAGGSLLPADATTTTSWQLDDRGLTTSATDANGNVTTYVNDEAGHKVVTSAPSVPVETAGGTPVQAHPVTTIGYNTFGEAVETQDPDGNVVTTAYDADGNVGSVTQPNYTAPGTTTSITASTINTYDKLGNLQSSKDPVGNITSYAYDQRGLTATVTAPDNSVTHTTYYPNGQQASITDGNGATTQTTWDYLGNKKTSTQLERYPTAASYTTQYNYDANGWPLNVTSPTGVVTQTHYNNVGELAWSIDGANNKTTYGYDFLGDPSLTTLPDGTSTETDYNALQLPYQTIKHDSMGAVLTQTSSILDGNGNPQSVKDARGNTTTFQYDPSGVVTSETQPVSATASITTSFGYDAAGNRTRYTDGNGSKWITTYNSWNLPESYIEPATSQYTAASDSTFTTAYDADGRQATQTQPGGVTVTTGYDAMGNVTAQSGTGAEAPTASRSFSYDHLGRALTATTAAAGTQTATSDTFTYNDRGDLLTATGSAGSSSFAYNADNAVSSRTDASGTTGYGYDTAGRLQTINDGASGNTLTYQYNNLDQVNQINYGTGQNVRTFGYDTLHRLQTDTLKTSGGSAIASITYGYDSNNNLTSKTTSGYNGAAANTYSYDFANRLTSWNNGTATVAYGYDNNGNRTQVGSAVYTYDARDELTSDGTGTYTYSARGTQTSKVGTGASSATFDAYGQAVTDNAQTYTYDAVARPVTDATSGGGTRTLSYSGATDLVAGDGANVYSHDPGGNLLGIGVAGQSTGSGLQAMVDAHTDVVGAFTATGSTLSGSTAYDPLGNKLGTATTPGSLGYQSQWAEASSGKINMGSRWYNPANGQFTSRDTKLNNPIPNAANANPFAYAADNPMTLTDPTGHDALDDANQRHAGVKALQQEDRDARQLADDAENDDLDSCGYHGGCVQKHAHLWETSPHYVHDRINKYVVGEQHHWASLHKYLEKKDVEDCGFHGACQAKRINLWQHSSSYVANKTSQFLEAAARANAQAEAGWAAKAKAESTPPPVAKAKHSGGFFGALKAAGNFVYHASGLSDIVDCVSHPNLSSCLQAALTVATTLGTGGESMAGEALIEGVGKDLLETGFKDVAKTGAEDAAKAAEKDVAHTAEDELGHEGESAAEGESCELGVPHSFVGTTPVLMANGASKPISEIKPGDTITNSQPGKTGKTETHKVDAVIVTYTDHDFTDVTVATPHGDKTITTTFHHPFYDLTQSAFVLAADLKVGDKLQTPDGTTAIQAVRNYHTTQVTYDLTIDGLHTYYVEAGDTPVLVHNCDVGTQVAHGSTDLSRATAYQRVIDGNDGNLYGAVRMNDGNVFVAHSNEFGHAEKHLLDRVAQEGYSAHDVDEMYTEYGMCPICQGPGGKRAILPLLRSDVKLTYSIPFADQASRPAAKIALKGITNMLFGR